MEPGSIAEDLGWQPGDEIIAINGHRLNDILDYRFYSTDEFLTVEVRRGSQIAIFEIEKDFDTPLGVEFQDILFDGVRTCGAHCVFCFVEQLPKGLRKPLYLKDDDYRLSFLHGNFVTLANVTEEDLRRIVTQRLSPLYISVHTTQPALRRKMLGRNAPDILSQIDALASGRIALHTQIVLCRRLNDADHLDRTIEDLASRYPTVQSIAIVPAGLSAHRRDRTPIGSIDPDYSRHVLRKVRAWQKRYLVQHGARLVWAADEFYLNAGQRVPRSEAYEGFPQLENGVGLVRRFQDSARRAAGILTHGSRRPVHVSVTTGTLASSILTRWVESLPCENLRVSVYPVTNRLFGDTVTVAGLIAGRDIIDQLRGRDLGEALFVPSISVRDGMFIDNITLDQVERELGARVIVVYPRPYQLVRAILRELVGGAQ